jgi:hypothetical protein
MAKLARAAARAVVVAAHAEPIVQTASIAAAPEVAGREADLPVRVGRIRVAKLESRIAFLAAAAHLTADRDVIARLARARFIAAASAVGGAAPGRGDDIGDPGLGSPGLRSRTIELAAGPT